MTKRKGYKTKIAKRDHNHDDYQCLSDSCQTINERKQRILEKGDKSTQKRGQKNYKVIAMRLSQETLTELSGKLNWLSILFYA